MDIFMPIAICVIFIIIFSICGWCCKRKREGTIYGYGPTVTVSSQPVQASPVVVPPYPVEARHPTPHSSAPAPGFTAHSHPPYPTHMPYPQPGGGAPYPPTSISTPYPPAGGAPYPPSGGAPYPPGSAAAEYNSNPPPYDVAVASPPMMPPTKEVYGKQAPYNPQFS